MVLDLKLREFPKSSHCHKQDAIRKTGGIILQVNERKIRKFQHVLAHVSLT